VCVYVCVCWCSVGICHELSIAMKRRYVYAVLYPYVGRLLFQCTSVCLCVWHPNSPYVLSCCCLHWCWISPAILPTFTSRSDLCIQALLLSFSMRRVSLHACLPRHMPTDGAYDESALTTPLLSSPLLSSPLLSSPLLSSPLQLTSDMNDLASTLRGSQISDTPYVFFPGMLL
jgi:hypothetical protein